MKNLKIRLLAALVLCAVTLTACSNTGGSSAADSAQSGESQSSTVSSAVSETSESGSDSSGASQDSTEQDNLSDYDKMVQRSLMSTGNLERMTNFINKLENKEEVTIAFIGGSITEGLTAGAEKCWAKLTYDYLCEKYPDTKINYVNAGMSGTPSILGNIRVQRDVLDYKPDLVFVEFAVNDGNDQLYKDSYEALVRTILSQEQNPAVALYFTVIKSGHTCESFMSQVGEAYGLPMVSLNNALKPEFDSGAMTWEDYSDDESHPNEWGHEMTRDLIVNMLEKVTEEVKAGGTTEVSPLPEARVFSDRFEGMTLIDRAHESDKFTMKSVGSFSTDQETLAQFPDGWSVKMKPSECEAMEFEFTGKNLFLIYRCVNSKKFGSALFTVDGKEAGSFLTSANDGWSNPVAKLVYSGDEGTHTVSVKLDSVEDDSSMYLEILGFGIC